MGVADIVELFFSPMNKSGKLYVDNFYGSENDFCEFLKMFLHSECWASEVELVS